MSEVRYTYPTHSHLDLAWGLVLSGAGVQAVGAGEAYPPPHPESHAFSWERGRRLDECQLVYLSEGAGEVEFEAEKTSLKRGQALLILPGHWHRYRPDATTGWKEHWFGLRGPTLEVWMQSGALGESSRVLECGLREDLLTGYGELLEVESQPLVHPLGASKAMGLLALALQCDLQAGQDVGFVQEARVAMREAVEGDLDLQQLALDLGMSYHAFRLRFKQVTGLAPKQCYLQMKMQRARQLLGHGLPVGEVAERLAFDNVFYFSRCFKERVGLSPTAWVKELG